MSAIARAPEWISPEDYLQGERSSEVRHEYFYGATYAMAGGSDNHNRIARNIVSYLDDALADSPCEPFGSDMKVRIPPSYGDIFYYPDAMVVCDPTDNARFHRERPTFIFEVLSPDTERRDRGEKATAYRQIATIEAYILIEQTRMAATILHQAQDGWRTELIEGTTAVLHLPKLNVDIPFKRVYRKTTLVTSAG